MPYIFKMKTWLLFLSLSFGISHFSHAAVLVPVSKKEQRSQMKELRKNIKNYILDQKANDGDMDGSQVLAIIFAVLIPPVGVLIHEGRLTNKFWISLLLTILFWLPGAIYSLLVVTGNA